MVRRGIVIPAFEEVMMPELKNEFAPTTETGNLPLATGQNPNTAPPPVVNKLLNRLLNSPSSTYSFGK